MLRHLGRGRVRLAGHDRRHRAGEGARLIGVVRQAAQHQHRAEIGVAQPERAEVVRQPGDLLARELRHQHADLEHHRPEPDRVPIRLDIDLAGLDIDELDQVQAGQIAGRVVEEHVLASRDCWR